MILPQKVSRGWLILPLSMYFCVMVRLCGAASLRGQNLRELMPVWSEALRKFVSEERETVSV